MGGFKFDEGALYRMPVMFGPTVGPRQGPTGERFDWSNAPFDLHTVRYLSDADALDALLPRGFSLRGEPVVTLEFSTLFDLAWLGGRSYSMLGVKLPVTFDGADETLTGALLTVLWENRPEPILSGREELGYNKLYCDLPAPLVVEDTRTCRASWDGFEFFTMKLSNLAKTTPPKGAPVDGTLHYCYSPARGDDTPHEARTRVMIGPTPKTPSRIETYVAGDAEFAFNPATFEQMPTMFQVVNTLAALPVRQVLGGSYLFGRGKGDLSDQRPVAQKTV